MSIYGEEMKSPTQLMEQFLSIKVQDLREKRRRETAAVLALDAPDYWSAAAEKARTYLNDET